jgi:hypothetical protein
MIDELDHANHKNKHMPAATKEDHANGIIRLCGFNFPEGYDGQ